MWDVIVGGLAWDKMKAAIRWAIGEKKEAATDKLPKYITPIPKPSETFTGRTTELREVRELLKHSPVALIVNGLGGIGKTALAKKFVAEETKGYDHVGWLTYSGSLKSTFVAGFGDRLGIRTPDEEEAYRDILTYLENLKGRNLLVIDNYDHPHESDSFEVFPGTCKILITSREKVEGISEFSLETLSLYDANKLFVKLAPGEKDPDALNLLLDRVGCHSLMVEKIARTIHKAPHLNAAKILEIFESRTLPEIKARADKKQTIFEHLSRLYTVDALDTETLGVLQWFSILPTVDYPYDDLLKMFGIEEAQYDGFVNRLHTLTDSGWLIHVGEKYRCHQMIREYILYHHAPPLEGCLAVVSYFAGESSRLWRLNPISAAIVIPSMENLLECFSDEEHDHLATLANNLSQIYQAMGDLKSAKTYAEKSLAIREKVLGADHPDLATGYSNLSLIYYEMGDFKSAKTYAEKALAIMEKVLGADHPSLATSYNTLSVIYRAMGDLKSAKTYAEKALAIMEKVLGANHPSLAAGYNNLSVIYRDMGDLKSAKTYAEKDLAISEKVLGADHPDLATSYHNLSLIYWDMGDLESAKATMEKAIAILEKLFPGGHPNLETSRRNYQRILAEMEK